MAKAGNKTRPWIFKPLKFLIGGVFILFIIIIFYNGVRNLISNAVMFKVKEIVINRELSFIQSRHLERLKGQSIFSVDLKKVQRQLQAQYPHIDQLRIIREFPDRICLIAKRREPFARLTFAKRSVGLDKEGIALPLVESSAALPEIRGADSGQRLVFGQPFNDEKAGLAMDIIKEIRTNKYLDQYRIKTIDVHYASRVELYLAQRSLSLGPHPPQIIFVIIDGDRIQEKVQALGILLSQGKLRLNEIKYIDLRFKEPILGKNEQ